MDQYVIITGASAGDRRGLRLTLAERGAAL